MRPCVKLPVYMFQQNARLAACMLVGCVVLAGTGAAFAQEHSAQASLEQQARSAQRAGDYEQAEALWSQAVEEAHAEDDAASVARYARELLACRMQLTDYDGAIIAAQLAATAYEHLEEPAQAGQVYTYLGSLLRATGEYERSTSAYRLALDLFTTYEDIPGQAAAHMSLAILADLQGLLPKAASEFGEAREQFRALGDSANVALCYGNQGYALERLGMLDRALAAYEQAEYLYAGQDDPLAQARMLIACGRVQARQGEHSAAQARYEAALTVLGPDGAAGMRAQALAGSGAALAAMGELDAARTQLEAAWGIFEELEDYTAMRPLAEQLAKVASALGDGAAAERYREWRAPAAG